MKKIISLDEGMMYSTKKWFEEYPKAESASKHGKSEMEVLDLKAEAKKCIDSESAAYHLKQSKSRNSEYSWLKTALSKGTISDKVAAGIVLIQNSPKHNLNHLTSLVSQVKVSKHNQCSTVITAIRDLFLTDLLHPQFKLLKFEEQDLDKLDHFNKAFTAEEKDEIVNKPTLSKNKLLTNWYFEDQLKELYGRFVSSLSTIANDTVDANREKAVSVMNDLLMGNAEQEHKLLDFLVNKIGDPSSKVASKAVFSLTKLLNEHPNMKSIVLKEVEKLLFRTNVSTRAQYFSICLLTQFVLSKEDSEVATLVINVYFAFFKACLKKGEPDSRMMAAILAGVNRAYPFSDAKSIKLNDHIDSVYKVVHFGSFNVSLNALSLLFQVVGKDPNQSNRFYAAFYRKLLDLQIGTASKRAIFLNLLFRVLRSDHSIIRLHAFIKRVLQISTCFSPNMTCAILYVVSQVLQTKKLTNKILIKSVTDKTEEIPSHETSNNIEVEIKKNEDSIFLSNVISENINTQDQIDLKPEEINIKSEFKATDYDPFCRNPLHSGANLSIYYELEALQKHYHPSVALFAHTIIQGKSIEYSGDPLGDLSLIRFLDRYVFKNPKKLESKKVTKKNDLLLHRAAYTPKGVKSIPVDSLAYVNQREDKIPVDELFLYQYLLKRKEFKGLQKEDEEDDNESVNSEDFNSMLDELSKNKNVVELDIASDFNAVPNKLKDNQLKSKSAAKVDSDDDISDESNDSNIEISESEDNDSMAELEDLDDLDDDLSDMEFSDNDEEFVNTSKKRKKNEIDRQTKKSKDIDENTFVSAEKFAEILENQAQSKFKHRSSATLNDRDGASVKQLDWETERNQRISGFGTKGNKKFNHSKNKGKFSKNRKPSRKR